MKFKLVGSTATLNDLLKMVCKYFYSESIGLNDDGTVSNSKGIIEGFRWSHVRGRYRLERELTS